MQVVERSTTQLKLSDRAERTKKAGATPWFCAFLIGLPAIVMLKCLMNFGVTTLDCQRLEPALVRCEKQERTQFGLVEAPRTTHQIVEAQTYSSRFSDHAVSLRMSQGGNVLIEDRLTLPLSRDPAQEMEQLAEQVNQFIQSDEAEFSVVRDDRLRSDYWLFLGAIATLPLLAILLFYWTYQSEEILLDHDSGYYQRQRKTLMGKRTQVRFPLEEITDVTCTAKGKGYRLRFLPESLGEPAISQRLPLRPAQELQREIQHFLRLPAE